MQKIKIELDEKFLNKFFGLTNTPYKIETLTLMSLRAQLENIEDELTSKYIANYEKKEKKDVEEKKIVEEVKKKQEIMLAPEKILIYNHIGLFSYQISDTFKRLGHHVVCTKKIDEALKLLKEEEDFTWLITNIHSSTIDDDINFIETVNFLVKKKILDCNVGIVSLTMEDDFKEQVKDLNLKFCIKNEKDWKKKLKKEIEKYTREKKVIIEVESES